MSIVSFCMRLVWSRILYTKKGVNALFICKAPKYKNLETKKECQLDTTKGMKGEDL